MLEQAGLDDHCSRNHARSCTSRDICSGIRTCSLHETEFTAQNICLSHSGTKVRKEPVKVSMHALACALRLHGCSAARLPCVFTSLKIQASIHVHVYARTHTPSHVPQSRSHAHTIQCYCRDRFLFLLSLG